MQKFFRFASLWVLASLISVCAVQISYGQGKHENVMLVEQNTFRTSAYELREQVVNLTSQWFFYPDTFLYKINYNYSGTWEQVSINSSWRKYKSKGVSDGYGTYALTVLVDSVQAQQNLSVFVDNIASAFRLYANGKLIGSLGKVGNSVENYSAEVSNIHRRIFALGKPIDSKFEIVIQVANFHHKEGGIIGPIQLSESFFLENSYLRKLLYSSFSLGIIFLFFLTYLTLYFKTGHSLVYLWFSISSALIMLWILMFNKMLHYSLAPLGWEVLMSVEYSLPQLACAFMFMFARELFPEIKHNIIVKVLIVLGVVFGSLILLLPGKIFLGFSFVFNAYLAMASLYFTFGILISISRSKRPYGKLMLVAMLFMASAIVNDVLNVLYIIETLYVTQHAFLLFIFALSYILQSTYAETARHNQLLNAELEKQKEELEHTVAKRTQELRDIANDNATQAQKLSTLNVHKDKMLSIIGHDLRGPVGTIASIVEVMDLSKLDADDRELAGFIKNSAEASSELLENLLLWARAEASELEMQEETIVLRTACTDTVNLLYNTAAKKNITLHNQVQEGAKAAVDSNMFSVILRNLVSNALKFTPIGGTVTVNTQIIEEHIEVQVTDTGIGMDEATKNKILDKSCTLSTHGTEHESGSGLGLKLCMSFIEAHGGELTVKSTLGSGSTFSFRLPLVK